MSQMNPDNEKDAAKILKSRMNSVLSELILARESLIVAQERLEEARKEEVDSVNAVNRLQRDFDIIVREVKKSPGERTDWSNAARAK